MLDLTLVVVAKDVESMREFGLAHIDAAETILFINAEGKSLSAIGNEYLDKSRRAVFALVHYDVVFNAGSLEIFYCEAMQGKVCGVVGSNPDYSYPDNYIWANKNPGPVSTLDSASCFFRRDLGLRFDEQTFDGLHLQTEDLCLQAGKRGIPVTVPGADAYHNACNRNGVPWHQQYEKYLARFSVKWNGVRFSVT